MAGTIVLLSPGEAQRLTQRIKLTAGSVRDGLFKLRNLVDEAKNSNAWQVLGFASWTAYLADTLADEPMRLGRDERRELVEYLSGEGLSTRAIAPIVGAGVMTVQDDIARVRNRTPEPEPDETEFTPEAAAAEARRYAEETVKAWEDMGRPIPGSQTPFESGEAEAEPEGRNDAPPRVVTGLDGKTYAQKPKAAPRRALTDTARDTGWEIRKVAEKIQRIREDDRFSRNKEEVAAFLRGHLIFVIETCQGILDDLDQSQED